jgi:hypothetical protein
MGFLHLVQGIFMILVSYDTTRSLKPNMELFYELPFRLGVSFFLLISAVAKFLPGDNWLGALCSKPEGGYEPGALLRISTQFFVDDCADRGTRLYHPGPVS